MTCPYVEGQTIIVKVTFNDSAGVLVDPAVVTATVEAPDGTQTTPTADNISTGIYHVEVAMDETGWWKVRVVGTTEEGDAVCETQCCAKPSTLTDMSPSSP